MNLKELDIYEHHITIKRTKQSKEGGCMNITLQKIRLAESILEQKLKDNTDKSHLGHIIRTWVNEFFIEVELSNTIANFQMEKYASSIDSYKEHQYKAMIHNIAETIFEKGYFSKESYGNQFGDEITNYRVLVLK